MDLFEKNTLYKYLAQNQHQQVSQRLFKVLILTHIFLVSMSMSSSRLCILKN